METDEIQRMLKELENVKTLTPRELEFLEATSDWFHEKRSLRPSTEEILKRIHKENV